MEKIRARSLFNPAAGYIRCSGYDWTCNPYLGCSFGCAYCYALFLPQNSRPQRDWGKWFAAKSNAVDIARRQAHKLAGQAIYLSTVTDPYLPAERSLCLTRGILEALVPHQPRVLIQTRSPLVVRDADVLSRFEAVRVNVSITTDSETVRQAFEPKAPPLERRWQALAQLKAAGLPVGICVTPMLPLNDVATFARRLAEFGPNVLVIEDFHNNGSCFGGDTGAAARRLLAEHHWTAENYLRCAEQLRSLLPVIYEGAAGFFPPTRSPQTTSNNVNRRASLHICDPAQKRCQACNKSLKAVCLSRLEAGSWRPQA